MPQANDTAVPPTIPDGIEIYDMLMNKIEPELVSMELSSLDEKHEGETEGERKIRLERYRKAFEQYDEAFSQYSAKLTEKVAKYRKQVFSSKEKEDMKSEEAKLANMESLFSS